MTAEEEEENVYCLLADDRHIVETLLDISDQNFPLLMDDDAMLYVTDSISGWIPPNRTFHRKRKKEAATLPTSENNANKKNCFTPNAVAFFDWRTVAEPDTFRYVYNSSYHRMKLNHRRNAKNDSCYFRAKNARRQLTAEQRTLQKEIRRDLKKEADNHQQRNGSNFNLSHSQSDVNISKKRTKSSSPKEIVLTEDDITSSLRALDLSNVLTKSFSEQIAEKFSSKIIVMDEEMKKDMQNKLRKRRQTEPTEKLLKIASDLEALNTKTKSHSKNGKNNMHVPKLDTLAQETFHIRSVLKSNPTILRPLTKVTPHQRMNDDNHKMLLTQLRFSKSLSETHPSATPTVPPCTYAWENDCYNAPIASNDETKINANKFANLEEAILSRAIKKIIPQQRTPPTTHKDQKAKFRKPVAVPASHPVSTASINTAIANDEQNVNCYIRKASIPGQHSVAALFLPELSGKRMEIASTNHRIT